MRKKIVLIGICVLIVLLVIVRLFSPNMPWSKNKAKHMAINYLEEKYAEQMEYIRVRIPFISDSFVYHVYFSPKNQKNIEFEVRIRPDFTFPECPDDYLLKLFSYNLANEVQGQLDDIWEENAIFRIIVRDQPLHGFYVADEMKESMDTKEMATFIGYDLYVTIDKPIESGGERLESTKILELIQRLKASDYLPQKIILFYQPESTIRFHNWRTIENASQVEDIIKKNELQ